MDARRLLARLLRLLHIPARARTAAPVALTAVATNAGDGHVGSTTPTQEAGRLRRASVASWLVDGRRVRPRVGPLARAGIESRDERVANGRADGRSRVDRQDAARTDSARVTIPLQRVAPNTAAPSAPAADGGVPARASANGPASSVFALPPDIRVDFTGELSAVTLQAIEQLDATQRRLIFLRYLVEQGVYNEGFGAHPLPEQYWRSRGLGDQSNE